MEGMHLEGLVQEHSLACEESKALLDCYTEVKSRLLTKLPSTFIKEREREREREKKTSKTGQA
jgi:hypothetical protein